MPLSPAQFQHALAAADSAYHRGDLPDALRQARALWKAAPGRGEVAMVLSATLLALGEPTAARDAVRDALRSSPGNPALLYALSRAYLRLNRLPEAMRAIDSALAKRPSEPVFLGAKAEVLLAGGDAQAAYDLLKSAAETGGHTLALPLARAAALLGHREESVDILRGALDQPGLTPAARAELLYELGTSLDALGEWDAAFAAFSEANALRRYPYDARRESRAVDALIRAWTPEALHAIPQGKPDPRPVFIVGFWRSGTTLVEQTLACHPLVHGAGELDYFPRAADGLRSPETPSVEPLITDPARLGRGVAERIGRGYLTLLRSLSREAARITDKMPTNILQLGLISRVLPGAPVILCTRDPVDTCLSCFFNMRGNMSYAHDLRDLGLFYRDVERLAAHWRSVLDSPLLDVSYEAFVADHDSNARRLTAFAGLEWDSACLRPHENRRVAMTRSMDQVRRPVYASSVARWRNYERHLGPLLEALGSQAAG
jgi:tetratricopeptide (TPR) repeat protein